MRSCGIPGAWSGLGAATIVVAAAAAAPAELDVSLPNKARVAASFAEGTEVHTFRVVCPAGAKLTVAAKPGKGGPALRVRILDPGGTELAVASGARTGRAKATLLQSGPQSVEVTSLDGAAVGAYSLQVSWKSRRSFTATAAVEEASAGVVVFSGDLGANATLAVRPARKSEATPSFQSVVPPDGGTRSLAAGRSAKFVLDRSGDYAVRFGSSAAGDVNVRVALRPPKVRPSSVRLDASAIPRGVGIVATKTIGPAGGAIDLTSGLLTGVSVSFPAGSLPSGVPILVGTSAPIAGTAFGDAAGPAVFFGPEGLSFAGGTPATITIPFDPSLFAGTDGSGLRVYTRDATGAITLVGGVAVDMVGGFVTFPAPHFSVFQVVRAYDVAETQRLDNGTGSSFLSHGRGVAVAGDIAAVTDFSFSLGSGLVAYRRTAGSFAFEERLAPAADGMLAIAGDRIALGSANIRTDQNVPTGGAYVYTRSQAGTWSSGEKVIVPGSVANDGVGISIAFDGATMVLGAPNDEVGGERFHGAVHVLTLDSQSGAWTMQQTLRPGPGQVASTFGLSVALHDDTLVVGAPLANRVHVYRRTAGVWTEAATLDAPELAGTTASFGTVVAFDGQTLVAAATPGLGGVPALGGIRIFEESGPTFVETARFGPADVCFPGERLDIGLGTTLSLDGDRLVAGAPTADVRPLGSAEPAKEVAGNAFVFARRAGRWTYVARLRGRPDDAHPIAASDRFATSISLDGSTLLVGAPFTNESGLFGAAYVFDLAGD